MTSPPPILPPLRSFDFGLPTSLFAPDHIAASDSTSIVLASSDMDVNDAIRLPQALPGREQSPSNTSPQAIVPPVAGVDDDADDESIYDNDHGDDEDDEGGHEGNDDDDEDDEEEDGQADEDSDDDEQDRDGADMDPYPWRPINEDTSKPCDDEQTYIEAREEHSAKEHAYWERETFFDLEDPDLKPGAHGRIDWTIPAFNGTKEKPNKQLVMRSPIVRIGEHEWQIKMYPKGDRTEFISVYVECLTVAKPDFVDQVDFKHPPLPVVAGTSRIKRRVSVAAQLAVVMYNPAEPRVYEYKTDAHQFHKQSADFGWKYFSREARYEFHMRRYGQRQAILRDDRLAFSAYIRIVDDPTGCLWETRAPAEGQPTPTGLRPFDGTSPRLATYMLLFHLVPFRRWLYNAKSTAKPLANLQSTLEKLLTRKLSRKHLRNHDLPSGGDIVSVLHAFRAMLVKETTAQVVADFDAILGGLDCKDTPISYNRLETSRFDSIQQAVNTRPVADNTPAVLTLELERQYFSKSKRKWDKVSNAVHLDDKITYGGTRYTLYAFVTHSGSLGSSNYVPHVRPAGPGKLWYAYDSNYVKCLTQKAAEHRQTGTKAAVRVHSQTHDPYHSPPPSAKKEDGGIAYLAMYVRQDTCAVVFSAPAEEVVSKGDGSSKDSNRFAERGNLKPDHSRAAPRESKGAHASSNVAPPNSLPADIMLVPPIGHRAEIMDGEDVIMSDGEDNAPSQSYINNSLQGSGPASAVGTQEEDPALHQKCINYFSGPFYDGFILADGKYHGSGHLISTNGNEYTGDFRHGKPHGSGTMIYGQSGDKYIGDWVDGQHHGQGKFMERGSGNVFDGGWKEGRRHGAFVLRGSVTDDDKQYCQICYEKEMNTAFYDCGHVLACASCAAAVQQCPVCRKQVLARLELFGVKVSMQ